MKFWKRFLNSYFLSIGCTAFFLVIFKSVLADLHSDLIIHLLQGLCLGAIPTVLTAMFLFQKADGAKTKWLKRLIFMIIVCISHWIAFHIIGVFKSAEPIELIRHFTKYLLYAIVLSIPTFVVTDIIQKRNLKKINEKLKLNEEDE